jgi:hypothetical protein
VTAKRNEEPPEEGQLSMGATEMRSPDELMTVLKRYLRESNESEMVVASRIGINRHTLSRWLTTPKPDEIQVGANRVLPHLLDTCKHSADGWHSDSLNPRERPSE